ncbi:3-oxoacyl-[acyl-carrier-protein] synthase III C-terminal domain-containing protein [Streptomonospora litoralis]|uniref:3-oxoacyl-[acyl-carrier-protein] synthase 3 n=1 Tax=Streptomonospora litoralis TaxID=2498135 RepID=A0A4P6PY49_9ACTN|nr:3-oxoacyl-[acyl-carrier-protein] synthase III C-terminal domain-containing protein [Streptomonospora litoralis]QBI52620.1 3-oxoacyl-[acyl-carrier-protein] synthase 3 [Streptomonospora litoralis]
MTRIVDVGAHVPPESVPVAEIGRDLGMDSAHLRVIRRIFGFSEVRMAPGMDQAGIMAAAVSRLDAFADVRHRVRYVVQARTMPVASPYPVNPLHEACRKLGLDHATAFTLTEHACAGGLLALHTCGEMLAADGDPDALGLVLVGEKIFTPMARQVPGSSINGESTAAVLVSPSGRGADQVVAYASRAYPRFHGRLEAEKATPEFQQMYPEALAEVLVEAAARGGLDLADVDLILPHNVAKVSWQRLCRVLGYPVERVFLDNVPVTGHCFGADAFVAYRALVDGGRLKPGDHYLMATAGLGATFAATLVRH